VLATSFGVFALLPAALLLPAFIFYSYTLTYPTVLTIVHSDGTYILSLHTMCSIRMASGKHAGIKAYGNARESKPLRFMDSEGESVLIGKLGSRRCN
jgi:hypothetical protein